MSGMRRVLIVVIFLGSLAAIALACGSKATPTPTPSLSPTPMVTPIPTYTPTATAPPTPTLTATPTPTPTKVATPTPEATATLPGLPFPEVKFKSGDWAKYQTKSVTEDMIQEGTWTFKLVEIALGGSTYEGLEMEMDLRSTVSRTGTPIPSYLGSFVVVSLTEKGKPGGKSWNFQIMGQEVKCFPGAAQASSEESNIPQGTTFTTDTYKVPEGGRVIKVWKYRTDEGEVWLSNEVPMYMVKYTVTVRGTVYGESTAITLTTTTTFELLAYGSGAPLAVTSAALEASCK